MDGNGSVSLLLAPPRARTSAAFRTATATLAANTTGPGPIASFTSSRPTTTANDVFTAPLSDLISAAPAAGLQDRLRVLDRGDSDVLG